MGLYLGFVGPSDSVERETLLMSGSVSGALLAKMIRMSVCKYTRPDLDEANLVVKNEGCNYIVYRVHLHVVVAGCNNYMSVYICSGMPKLANHKACEYMCMCKPYQPYNKPTCTYPDMQA